MAIRSLQLSRCQRGDHHRSPSRDGSRLRRSPVEGSLRSPSHGSRDSLRSSVARYARSLRCLRRHASPSRLPLRIPPRAATAPRPHRDHTATAPRPRRDRTATAPRPHRDRAATAPRPHLGPPQPRHRRYAPATPSRAGRARRALPGAPTVLRKDLGMARFRGRHWSIDKREKSKPVGVGVTGLGATCPVDRCCRPRGGSSRCPCRGCVGRGPWCRRR